MEQFDHRRDRDKKAIGNKSNEIQHESSYSPHSAEEGPDERDEEKGQRVQSDPYGGNKAMTIWQHVRNPSRIMHLIKSR